MSEEMRDPQRNSAARDFWIGHVDRGDLYCRDHCGASCCRLMPVDPEERRVSGADVGSVAMGIGLLESLLQFW